MHTNYSDRVVYIFHNELVSEDEARLSLLDYLGFTLHGNVRASSYGNTTREPALTKQNPPLRQNNPFSVSVADHS